MEGYAKKCSERYCELANILHNNSTKYLRHASCKEYFSQTGKFFVNGYDENDNNNMRDETKCETNHSINNKRNNTLNKDLTKHDANDNVDLDNCLVYTSRWACT